MGLHSAVCHDETAKADVAAAEDYLVIFDVIKDGGYVL